jgi:hypothetical protein
MFFNTFNITTEHFLCHVNIVKLSIIGVVYEAFYIQSPQLVQRLKDTMTTISLPNTTVMNAWRPVLHFFNIAWDWELQVDHIYGGTQSA